MICVKNIGNDGKGILSQINNLFIIYLSFAKQITNVNGQIFKASKSDYYVPPEFSVYLGVTSPSNIEVYAPTAVFS